MCAIKAFRQQRKCPQNCVRKSHTCCSFLLPMLSQKVIEFLPSEFSSKKSLLYKVLFSCFKGWKHYILVLKLTDIFNNSCVTQESSLTQYLITREALLSLVGVVLCSLILKEQRRYVVIISGYTHDCKHYNQYVILLSQLCSSCYNTSDDTER